MSKVPKIQPLSLEQNATRLLYNKIAYTLRGNYKGYKQATIEYADLAVKNFDKVKNLKAPKADISLFSPFLPFYALRFLRIYVMDLFRTKTPAEKTLKKMAKAYKNSLKA